MDEGQLPATWGGRQGLSGAQPGALLFQTPLSTLTKENPGPCLGLRTSWSLTLASAPLPPAAPDLSPAPLCHARLALVFVFLLPSILNPPFPSYFLLPMHPASSPALEFCTVEWRVLLLFHRFESRAKHPARRLMESVSPNPHGGPAPDLHCADADMKAVQEPTVPNHPDGTQDHVAIGTHTGRVPRSDA